MTDQKGDQAALNGLVKDCYPDGWPWEDKDWSLGVNGGQFPVVGVDVDKEGNVHTLVLATVMGNIRHGAEGRYPLASTWVEGRLRELIGEAFKALKYNAFLNGGKGGYTCSFFPRGDHKDHFRYVDVVDAPTPIQALVAALRVLKQKEVGGDL